MACGRRAGMGDPRGVAMGRDDEGRVQVGMVVVMMMMMRAMDVVLSYTSILRVTGLGPGRGICYHVSIASSGQGLSE